MESFMIEKDGRKFKVYLSPDGFSSYEFTIYEIIPKKHWWSSNKVYLTHGLAWFRIKEEVLEKLNNYLDREKSQNKLRREFDEIVNTTIRYNQTEN